MQARGVDDAAKVFGGRRAQLREWQGEARGIEKEVLHGPSRTVGGF